jgi:phosphoribosylaminoimidazole-succinocarboxamide synthase
MSTLYESTLRSLPLLGRGKVRDNYAVGNDQLLIVTTDRLSAFDVIMGEPIPSKGRVLNQMANFWFDKLAHVVPNHLTGVAPETVVAPDEVEQVKGRAVVVKRLEGLSGDGRRVRRATAGRPAERAKAARADLHAGSEGRNGPSRRKHHV